jgi:hypothetical protein
LRELSSKTGRFSDILYKVMQENSQFDILAAELSSEERRKMLASIRSAVENEASPIQSSDDPPPAELEVHIKALGIIDRIRLFLARIITGRDSEEIVQGWIMRSMAEDLSKRKIDGIDGGNRQFREAFAADVERLKQKAAIIAPAVEIAARRRTELVLGLAMHFFPGVHQELIRKSGDKHIRSLKEESERFLKRQLSSAMEEMMGDIPSSSRTGMIQALHQADTMYRLGNFSYAGILASFEGSGQPTGRHCAFDYVTRSIEQLQNIFTALSDPVDLALLETLIILNLESPEAREDEQLFQQAIRDGLSDILDALGAFRRFAETYPLTLVLRIVKEDPWWKPRPDKTGEDWAHIYRTFFLERIHRTVLTVSLERTITGQLDALKEITSEQPRPVSGLPDGTDEVNSEYWYLGLVTKTLTGKLFSRVMPHLKVVLTGGEFYKSSNRAQFNDAFNEFEGLPGKIKALEKNLAQNGSWGMVIWGNHLVGEKKKMARRIDQEVIKIVEETQATVDMLVNVLGGILYARPGSAYDTLANYGQLGGRRNSEVIEELKETHANLQKFMSIMGEIGAVEKRARENDIVLDTGLADSRKSGGDAS